MPLNKGCSMASFEENMHRLIKVEKYKSPQAFAIAMSTLGRACGVEGKLGSPEEIVKAKSEARLHEYEQYVDDEGYIHDDEGNVEFVGKRYAGNTYGLRDAPPGRPVSASRPMKRPSPADQAKIDAENEVRARKRRLEDQLYALEIFLQVVGPDKRIEAMRDIVKAGKDLSTKDLLFAHGHFKDNAWVLNAKLGRNPHWRFTPKGYDPDPRSGPSNYRVKPPKAFGFAPKKRAESMGRYIPLGALFE